MASLMSPFSTSLSPHYFQETSGRVEAWSGRCTTTSPRMARRHPQTGSRPTKAAAGLWADRRGGALQWEAQPAAGKMLQGKQARRRCGRAEGSTRSSVLPIGEAQLSSLSSSHSKALGRPKTHISHMIPSIPSCSIKGAWGPQPICRVPAPSHTALCCG